MCVSPRQSPARPLNLKRELLFCQLLSRLNISLRPQWAPRAAQLRHTLLNHQLPLSHSASTRLTLTHIHFPLHTHSGGIHGFIYRAVQPTEGLNIGSNVIFKTKFHPLTLTHFKSVTKAHLCVIFARSRVRKRAKWIKRRRRGEGTGMYNFSLFLLILVISARKSSFILYKIPKSLVNPQRDISALQTPLCL